MIIEQLWSKCRLRMSLSIARISSKLATESPQSVHLYEVILLI